MDTTEEFSHSLADMDPHAWGVEWFAQASANDRAFLENQADTPIKLEGYPPGGKQPELPCSQKDAKHSCLEEVRQNPAAAQQHLEREVSLLQRFDALLDRDYEEPYREGNFRSEFAPRAAELRATRLAQIRVALEITKGHDDAALNRWKRETAFILRQARNSHTLIDAMVLTAALNRYQRLLADYIGTHPAAARVRAPQLLAMLEPFDREAVKLSRAFESEAAFSIRSLLSLQFSLTSSTGEKVTPITRAFQVLAAPLLDRQATANEFAAQQLEYARIAALEGEEHMHAMAKVAAQQQQLADDPIKFSYHNPMGRIALSIAAPDYSKYLYKSDNILANKNLLAFGIDLLSCDCTSSEHIVQEIRARQAGLKHPNTGELPRWDAKNRTLSYPTREQDKGPNYTPLAIRL